MPPKMPMYKVSTFGRTYLADEEIDQLPLIRLVMVAATLILGLGTLLKFLLHLKKIKQISDFKYQALNSPAILRITILYILSHIIHNAHYADNIFRPVDYFEPKWLYQKYLISEMEITFFANFPISLLGLYYMEKLVEESSKGSNEQVIYSIKRLTFYIFGSLLTLGHYRTEPPWKYSAVVNFTIAGEGIVTILLAIYLFKHFINLKNPLQNNKQNKNNKQHDDVEDSTHLLESEEFSRKDENSTIRARTPVKF